MPDRFSLPSRLRIPEGILFHDLQDEVVILNLNTGVYSGLDRVGTRIWHLIHEHKSLRKVLDSMVEEFEVTEDRCAKDLLSFVALMQEKGLVEVVD